MSQIVFTSAKRTSIFGDWFRNAKVGDQEYSLGVRRGKMVRIAFKPRGQNRGWHWHGSVYRMGANGGRVWEGRVEGSIGCRGLLKKAGIIA